MKINSFSFNFLNFVTLILFLLYLDNKFLLLLFINIGLFELKFLKTNFEIGLIIIKK